MTPGFNDGELQPVRIWLFDFYSNTEGNTIQQIIGADIWNAEVDSLEAANSLVNGRLKSHIAWVAGFMRQGIKQP